MYTILYSNLADKDAKKIKRSKLQNKVEELLEAISLDPWQPYPPYKKLVGDLSGCYSRHINAQHRLVYEVFEEDKEIVILRMWTHYE